MINTDNPVINIFKRYDRLATLKTGRLRSPTISRYIWQSSKKVDFMALAQYIVAITGNVWKLYDFFYKNKELNKLDKGLEFGHSSSDVY